MSHWIIVHLICHISLVWSSDISNINKLHTDLLTGYNKDIRPPKDQTITIINASFNLVSIKDFDEVSGKFAIAGVFIGVWFDDRLVWNPLDYNMTMSTTIPQDKVWKPTLFLANVFESLKSIGHDFVSVRIYPNGLVVWTPPDLLTVSCVVDVTYFPFDQQNCLLQFVSFGTLPTEIFLHSTSDDANTPYYTEHGTWELVGAKTRGYAFDGGSMFEVKVIIKRRPLFFLVNIIFPVIFLTLLNSFVFLLPPESGERVSYAITVLLSIAVFMTLISNFLPKTSQTMSQLCYFLVGDLMMSSIICIFTIFQLRIVYKEESKYPIPKLLRKIVMIFKARKRLQTIHPQNSIDITLDKKVKQEMKTPDVDALDIISWKDVAKVFDMAILFASLLFQTVMVIMFFVILT